MIRSRIHPDTLAADICLLENSLLYWRWQAPDMEPICYFSEGELHGFTETLYTLATECWYMGHRLNAPPIGPYGFCEADEFADRIDLVVLTRALLFCCDIGQLQDYRNISINELEAVRILERVHAQLIGAEYGCRYGEDTVTSDDYTFK